MEDVRTRLNSHPIPTLRKILSATAKVVNIKGGFSRTLKTKKDIVNYMIELEKDMPEVSWDKIPLKDKPKKEKAPPKPKEKKAPAKPKKEKPASKPKAPSVSKVVKGLKGVKTLKELEQLFSEFEGMALKYEDDEIDKIMEVYETKKKDLMEKEKAPKKEKAPAKPKKKIKFNVLKKLPQGSKKKISKSEAQAIADSLDKPSKKSLIEQLQDEEDFANPTNVPKKKQKKK